MFKRKNDGFSKPKMRNIAPIAALILILFISVSCAVNDSNEIDNYLSVNDKAITDNITLNDTNTEVNDIEKINEVGNNTREGLDNLEVHFIDVGQADSILIKTPTGESMLIDAGNNADADLVTSYIKNHGIEKLDVVIGTHPHEDHIGGLDVVINNFNIEKIYMPKVTHNTKTYEDVLVAIQNKGLKISSPIPGTTFDLGLAQFTILAPNSSGYEDLNNYSIVLKMQYGNTSFLFTGDAEDISEREIINKGYDLSADVLKIAHHGSSSSTTSSFLDKVNPKYAVIMVGANNDYGHPHKETMDKIKAANIITYRTDENGTIVATSDGRDIKFNTTPGSYTAGGDYTNSSEESSNTQIETISDNLNDRIVYWTPNGKSYHFTDQCPTLSRSKTILNGPLSSCPKLDPCDKCTY